VLNLGASETVGSIAGAGNIALGSYTLTSGGSNSSTTLSGVISGTGGMTKNGTGTLTLAGSNAYTGSTTVSAGTIKAGSTSSFGSNSAVTVAAGATMDLGGFNNTINSLSTATGTITDSSGAGSGGTLRIATAMPGTASAQLFTGSMGLQLFGGSTVSTILTNTANTYSGGTTLGNGTGSTSTRILWTSGDIGAGTPGALTSGIFGTGVVTVGASTTDKSQIYMASGGTFKNAIVVNSAQGTDASEFGAFRIAASNPIIAGAINANLADATFNSINAGQAASVTGAISGNSGVVIMTQSAGVLNITLNATSGANTYAGNTTISTANATLTLGKADQISNGAGKGNLIITSGTFKMGGFSDTINGLSGNGTVDGVSGTPTLTIGDNDATSTFSGVIKNTAGTLALTKIGTGTLTLSGNNTYSGGTTINTGNFVIGHANAAGSGTITQNSGSSLLKFDTTGTITNAMSVYNVLASQSATLSGAITVNNATWDIETGDTLTISGAVSGSGGVTKNGGGTLTLNGTNTYNGSTVVNAGTLNANSTNALGSNNTVQVNGGTLLVTADDAINGKNIELGGSGVGLRFSGTYNGSIGLLTLNANSIIDLGTDPGGVIARFSDIDFKGYNLSFYNWKGQTLWGGTNRDNTDQVYIMAPVTPEELDRISFYSSNGGDSFLGTGFELGFSSGFADQIIPVPEPETYATGLLLLLGSAWWMWKRKPKAV
jgi:autotransporter-associated beta strand protein